MVFLSAFGKLNMTQKLPEIQMQKLSGNQNKKGRKNMANKKKYIFYFLFFLYFFCPKTEGHRS